ncbi:amidohydrolase family protein [Rhizobium lentis]|uniref:Amidohydrolase family protein n=1 Tax=Rhizobium lentis TaxID=1138194 RepID=A0ABS7I9B8_9HYPH|nr:amidohydrolase family protein [Rhizobium lentis]MBX5041201.1 amidohydrolase family protein [Rhizobium lentis]MBX5051900.1 amidohydrolase family protein [Rhizobium lentis]MBX5071458.1 amidohydrolase family protein [Rhizobium lentis]MBX5088434.1 amidohydrolase family protein [Rhizobium lentis]MBX5108504.1 amidohydrolase family protein [Rhizobium lentis]
MKTILIKNGYVVTVNGKREIHDGGSVAIRGKTISGVYAAVDTPRDADFDEVIDAKGCLVIPGLINLHQHHWYAMFKGIADGMLLEDWISDLVFPLVSNLSDDAMRLASYQCGIEMLATGTTTSFNHSVSVTTAETVKAIVEPQAELGIRQVFGKELRCRNARFLNHPLTLNESLAAVEEDVRNWDGKADGLIRMGMVIEANAHWTSSGMSTEELIIRGTELARKLGVKISSHIAGGTFSVEKGFLKHLRETGRTDVRYLMQLGVLDHQWMLIHGIHCTELDLEHMAHVGAGLVYTPTSEAVRGGGIAPAANALRAGVATALGTDGAMVDYTNDMLEQVKACVLFQHQRHLDPTRMSFERGIEMATINGAEVLGLADELGSLEAGKLADIAIFDMRAPHVGSLQRPLSAFVGAGKGSDARFVIVNGDVVYRQGEFTKFKDRERVLQEVETLAASVIDKAGLRHRRDVSWEQKCPPLAWSGRGGSRRDP